MNAQFKSKLRRQLDSMRARIGSDARSVAKQALSPSGGQDAGDLSNAPLHLGDEGTEEFLHDMNAALAENETYLLAEIQDAIARIDDQHFGLCEECGGAIAVERLEVMPYARLCVKCAEATQSGLDVNINRGRPTSPADTLAPEGAMQETWHAVDDDGIPSASRRNEAAYDQHAAGEPGGGSAIGGLAGSNSGSGEPEISDLQDAAGSGDFDVDEAPADDVPQSGRSGGAVGGTPARKRSS